MSDDVRRKPDAIELARSGQTRPLPKRFYTEVVTAPRGDGHAIHLDGRPLRTPGKLVLILPTAAMGEAIAAEWAVQKDVIDPLTMPLTRLANSVRDQVGGREREVRADIAKYAGSDLVCYRADSPEGLVAAQARAWDPVLDWARAELDCDLAVGTGIVHVAQSAASRAAIEAAVGPLDEFRLTAAHVITTLLGSVVLALAVLRGRLTADDAWAAAHVDEDWQIVKWGSDEEATRRRRDRNLEFRAALQLNALLDSDG